MLTGRAYGFRSVNKRGRITGIPSELQTIALVLYLHERGANLTDIAGKLNSQGKRTRTGRYWQTGQVSRIIARAAEYRAALEAQEG